MISIVNKKGQSGEGGMLIWIVVAIIAAIVVILFFTGGFDIFKNLFKQAPQTLEAATQACKIVATPETRVSYCDQWREVDIGGETQLVNCQYPPIKNNLDLSSEIECNLLNGTRNADATAKAVEYCGLLLKSAKITEKTKVNNLACTAQTCEALTGSASVVKGACPAGKSERSKGFLESKDGKVCCI